MNVPELPVEFGYRIRVERKRLNKNQGEIAALCGSSREMWGRYERGTHSIPGNVLRSFVDAGADMLFLRTGSRTEQPIPLAAPVPPQDRGVGERELTTALEVLQDLLKKQPSATGNKVLVELAADEYELVLAYRGATTERREVFLDLVNAQKRRALG